MKSTPNTPPSKASVPIFITDGAKPQRKRAGMVNMVPEASDEDADPVVCAMLFSRIDVLPQIFLVILKNATAMTASGIEVEMVSPTLKPKYAFAVPKKMPNKAPTKSALIEKSQTFVSDGINGLKSFI